MMEINVEDIVSSKFAAPDSGVYQILNTLTGDEYVGSSKYITRRWRGHISDFKYNRGCPHLRMAWNKYGEEAFVFQKLLPCNPSLTMFYEQQFLDQLHPKYNISQRADVPSRKGYAVSEETKNKLRTANLGKKHSEETKAKMSQTRKGRPHSEEWSLRISISNLGKQFTEEHRLHLSESHKGKVLSVSQRAKMSEAQKKRWELYREGKRE